MVELLPGALDSQLQRDADLTHFEYFTLAMLSEAPNHTLRMTALASLTNATLPYISAVADLGWQKAMSLDHAVAAGLSTHHGALTNLPVAKAHGLQAVDPYSLVS